jgi:UDPglucose 6-dehydrogenase
MQLAVVGTGYVGLVTGTCFAESGNDVCCIDIDAKKVQRLREGIIPIYEPGLTELVEHNIREGRLTFTTSLAEGIEKAKLVFVAVGTPQGDDGSANLSALWAVVDEIKRVAKEPKTIVIKSTVPVGTNAKTLARLNDGSKHAHRAASNPEFLKEGYAVEDFMRPDRVVVGVREQETADLLKELHAPFLRTNHPFLTMSPESSEMTKYVANCMLATKISFINEMANLCERLGADINAVRNGIGHDSRIGFQFLHPGVGYGGSCFPKDIRAVIALAKNAGLPSTILDAVDDVNERQKEVLFAKISELMGDVKGKTIALWGLAFKPRTDDIREASALVLIRRLLDAGASVRVHDPKAMPNVKEIFGDQIVYSDRAYGTLEGADLLAIVTEWQEFRNPDFEVVRRLLRSPVIVDGRNLYEPAHMKQLGFTYASIGRNTVRPK